MFVEEPDAPPPEPAPEPEWRPRVVSDLPPLPAFGWVNRFVLPETPLTSTCDPIDTMVEPSAFSVELTFTSCES